jgi:hypothetical protein
LIEIGQGLNMAIVRIIAQNQIDRLKNLGTGICRFGADFGCDVVLIDDGILPEHFTLRLDDGGVSILMHPGAEGELLDHSGQVHRLESGVVHAWPASRHLRTAGIEVHLGGAPVKVPARRPPAGALLAAMLAGRPRLSLFAVSSVVALLMMGNADTGAWLRQSSAAIGAVPAPPPLPPVLPGRSLAEVADLLRTRGLAPESLQHDGDMPEAVFYLDSVAERDAAAAAVASLGVPLRARFHLRTQLLSALRIILDGAGGRAELVELLDGHVVLGGLRDGDNLRDALRSRILGDVPGIRTVAFAEPVAVTDELASDIAAVWLGDRPYVVLSDGRIIRPGQSFSPDAALEKILSDSRISIRINGLVQEVSVR